MKSNVKMEMEQNGRVWFRLWLTAADGAAQAEDESKLLNFVFPGAQHALDVLRCVIFSSGRGATTFSCSLGLHSNKISTATWQAEKWQVCKQAAGHFSLLGFLFSNQIFSGLVSMFFCLVPVCGLLSILTTAVLSEKRQNERAGTLEADPWRRLQQVGATKSRGPTQVLFNSFR